MIYFQLITTHLSFSSRTAIVLRQRKPGDIFQMMAFVGLWVYTIVDGCVCVFQWGSHAAAFSGAELLLPSLSSEL
jgi:hypothetical protein